MKNHTKLIAILLLACLLIHPAAADRSKGPAHSPKNIIIMIADGCGFNHITASTMYQYGRRLSPFYAQFPTACAMSTFPANGSYDPNLAWESFDYVKHGCTDSAAAATAMSTGTKTYDGAIGVDINRQPLTNIVERCEQLGKSTGVITTVPISHATPAGFVAHNPDRDNYQQIARQMLLESAVDCIMGCGHPFYNDDGKHRQTAGTYKYVGGQSTWNALIAGTAGADADADSIDDPWTLVQTRAEFQSLIPPPAHRAAKSNKTPAADTPKRVLGIAQVAETLQQKRSGDKNAAPYVVPLTETVPTLEEMTKAALNVLDNNPDGFFLMIEGGAVDWAAHNNQSGRMLEEQIDFNRSISAVLEWIKQNSNWGETFLIVTADHETGYLTGPDSGETPTGPVWNAIENNGQYKIPGMQWNSGSHTNSLVPFFAKGADAHLFKQASAEYDPVRGPYIDNTDIANIIFALLEQTLPVLQETP